MLFISLCRVELNSGSSEDPKTKSVMQLLNRVFLFFSVSVICLNIFFLFVLTSHSSELKKNPPPLPSARVDGYTNIVFIYAGRWQFLRIQLPYLYRDLREYGGVIDKVQFMMVRYDKKTLKRLQSFSEYANNILTHKVFSIHHPKRIPYTKKPASNKTSNYMESLYEVCKDLIEYPLTRYFKLDDDVVYIHPKAFENMIEMKRSDCAFNYFNIAGCNWRCSWIHQKYGIFDREVNTKNLTFQFDPFGKCGWKSIECAKLTLQTFLHYYHHSQLEKYFQFDVEYLTDRTRFSINAFLLDNSSDPVRMKKVIEKRQLSTSDELMLAKFFQHTPNPPCVVGKALVLHFGYRTVNKQLLKMGMLKIFHGLSKKVKNIYMPSELRKLLDRSHD